MLEAFLIGAHTINPRSHQRASSYLQSNLEKKEALAVREWQNRRALSVIELHSLKFKKASS
ncbi:hypothetical protein WAK64_00980 [Bacillus spongiae]|uniref:Uncharacterized protein n=1 Tax=Bacillus spongiae TaxID=2683610 RepID=A0ABU8H8W3_9BACI